jgi:phospholipid-binding lipoprotein MlaA
LRQTWRRTVGWIGAAALGLVLGGCAAPPGAEDPVGDPYEAQNRAAHAFNKAVDRSAWGPFARGYGRTVPQPVRTGIGNLNDHWSLPGEIMQSGLQGRGDHVGRSLVRFGINTVWGVGGLLDPAAEVGLPYRETNVDETLHVWGVAEGGYLEVPLGGPGTVRDWSGWVLDIVLDPMVYVLPPSAVYALTGVAGLDIVNDRYELDPVIRTLYYESTDSYTAQRISYLQNKRARLQGGTELDVLEDPYADF